MQDRLQWLNEPEEWSASDASISMRSGAETDFWRITHYGFIHDSGHFGYRLVAGNFRATASFKLNLSEQYDQLGMMIRLSEREWIKAGVELVDGKPLFSVVVTHEFSDWSMRTLDGTGDVTVELARVGDSVSISYAVGDQLLMPVRMAYFEPGREVMVGLMCCAPDGPGFLAEFERFEIEPL